MGNVEWGPIIAVGPDEEKLLALLPHAPDVLTVLRAMADIKGIWPYYVCYFCGAEDKRHKLSCPVLLAKKLVEAIDGKG